MVGFVKNRVIKHIREEDALRTDERKTKWYEVMDAVVKDYNEEHVSSTTKMTPNEAADPDNTRKVKTNLESIRRPINRQPRLDVGDLVRVVIKKKFEKSYKPNYTEELFKVVEFVEPNRLVPTRDDNEMFFNRHVQYRLADPNKKLPHYKKTFMRSELLRVK